MEWTQILIALLELMFLDIILSVDNAIMIAATTQNLNEKDRKMAEIIGAAGAVLLRFIFVIIVMVTLTLLMSLPFLYIMGGMILVVLGISITNKKTETDGNKVSTGTAVLKAVAIIMAGDIMLSFDNAFIIADISLGMPIAFWGQILVVGVALFVSLIVIIFFASYLGDQMNKYHWIVYIAGWLLLSVGIEMMFGDYVWIWIASGVSPDFSMENSSSAAAIEAAEENARHYLTFLFSYGLGGIIILFKWWVFDIKLKEHKEKNA